ncbi:MAG: hypothetical protein GY943_00230 [Chloroflexi bacterium]|nr:hypothetical protein [Chloroflexota bacterium]
MRRLRPLLILIGLCLLAYLAARWLVASWLPQLGQWLLSIVPSMLISVPLFYRWLNQRYGERGKRPYFTFELDPILAITPYALLLFALITPLPQLAIMEWGNPATGTVTALNTETSLDFRPVYKLSYAFVADDDMHYQRDAYVSQSVFATFSLGDEVDIFVLPDVRHWSTLPDQSFLARQTTLILWCLLVLIGWLGGVWGATAVRHLPQPQETVVPITQQYGLDAIFTDADDFALWEAVLESHFPPFDDAIKNIDGLRFGVGQPAPAARFKIQPTIGYCFKCTDQESVVVTDSLIESKTDAAFDEALSDNVPMLLLYISEINEGALPYHTIVVERPSEGKDKVLVYTAVKRSNKTGYGATHYWQRHADGTWQQTNERLNWWMIG